MSDSGSDLKKELNSLWRSTVGQLDEIKDVLVKSSHAGKARIDAAFLGQKLEGKFQELGELVFADGENAAYPDSWREKMKEISELKEQIDSHQQEFDTLVSDVKDSIPDLAEVAKGGQAAEERAEEKPAASEVPDDAEKSKSE